MKNIRKQNKHETIYNTKKKHKHKTYTTQINKLELATKKQTKFKRKEARQRNKHKSTRQMKNNIKIQIEFNNGSPTKQT